MTSVNFHIYPSYFTNESRILREAKAIIELGLSDRIILIGLWKEGLSEDEHFGNQIRLVRIKTPFAKKGNSKWSNVLLFFFVFNQILSLAKTERPFALNIHSLTFLPFGAILKWIRGCYLIYDAHELETETHASKGVRKIFSKLIERLFIRFADYTIVVSHSIEKWYRTTYKIQKILTIRNIPVFEDKIYQSNLKSLLKLNEDSLLYVYVGLLSGGRGIDQILSCFKSLGAMDTHVVFIGYGDKEKEIRETVSSNIHFLPAVSPAEVPYYVAGADVGLSLIEPTCLSYYYSLPNKVFEYLASGLPFICSDFPDVKAEFESYDLCWFCSPQDSLQNLVNSLSLEEIKVKKDRVMQMRANWDWNKEKLKLLTVYHALKT